MRPSSAPLRTDSAFLDGHLQHRPTQLRAKDGLAFRTQLAGHDRPRDDRLALHREHVLLPDENRRLRGRVVGLVSLRLAATRGVTTAASNIPSGSFHAPYRMLRATSLNRFLPDCPVPTYLPTCVCAPCDARRLKAPGADLRLRLRRSLAVLGDGARGQRRRAPVPVVPSGSSGNSATRARAT